MSPLYVPSEVSWGSIKGSINDQTDLSTKITNETVSCQPPTSMFKVVNMFVNPETGKFVIQYEDTST